MKMNKNIKALFNVLVFLGWVGNAVALPDPYDATKTYATGEKVLFDGKTYIARYYAEKGMVPPNTPWGFEEALTCGTVDAGDWVANKVYSVGDIVCAGAKVYQLAWGNGKNGAPAPGMGSTTGWNLMTERSTYDFVPPPPDPKADIPLCTNNEFKNTIFNKAFTTQEVDAELDKKLPEILSKALAGQADDISKYQANHHAFILKRWKNAFVLPCQPVIDIRNKATLPTNVQRAMAAMPKETWYAALEYTRSMAAVPSAGKPANILYESDYKDIYLTGGTGDKSPVLTASMFYADPSLCKYTDNPSKCKGGTVDEKSAAGVDNIPTGYINLMRVVSRFPHFCGDTSPSGKMSDTLAEEMCQRAFAAIVGLSSQESGANDNTSAVPGWLQMLFATREQTYYGTVRNAASFGDIKGSCYSGGSYNEIDQYGACYYGRGMHQTSYPYNYRWLSANMLGDPDYLLKYPDQVGRDGYFLVASAISFYMTPTPSKPSGHDVMAGYFQPGDNFPYGGTWLNVGNVLDKEFMNKGYSALGMDINLKAQKFLAVGGLVDPYQYFVALVNAAMECSLSGKAPNSFGSTRKFTAYKEWLKILSVSKSSLPDSLMTKTEAGYIEYKSLTEPSKEPASTTCRTPALDVTAWSWGEFNTKGFNGPLAAGAAPGPDYGTRLLSPSHNSDNGTYWDKHVNDIPGTNTSAIFAGEVIPFMITAPSSRTQGGSNNCKVWNLTNPGNGISVIPVTAPGALTGCYDLTW